MLALFLASVALSADLPQRYQAFEGKTFSASGPNCFATAMKLAGVTGSFRGMDEKEFRALTALSCEKVEKPSEGDVGVFEAPGFGFVHAYLYLSPELGLQKPGVDYNGPTPISAQPLESIVYIYLASPECRRYSKNVAECSNQHYYLHCEPRRVAADTALAAHEAAVASLEAKLDQLLDAGRYGDAERALFLSAQADLAGLRAGLTNINNLDRKTAEFLSARLVSLEKQLQFLAPKFT